MLSQHGAELVRARVGRNPKTPAIVLHTLSYDSYTYVRIAVARNPSTPIEDLITLSTDPVARVRAFLAENTNAPMEVLMQLATDPDKKVRFSLGRNPNVSVEELFNIENEADRETLAIFAKDLQMLMELVRLGYGEFVAAYTDSESVLNNLAESEDSEVRVEVARNVSTPLYILQRLANDSDKDVRAAVRAAALFNPNGSTPAVVASMQELVRQELERDPFYSFDCDNWPVEILIAMSQSQECSGYLRREAAGNPRLPASILAKLCDDFELFECLVNNSAVQ